VAGDVFETGTVSVEVQSVDRHRVKRVRMTLIDEMPDNKSNRDRPEVALESVQR
jgi:hypothetical protein